VTDTDLSELYPIVKVEDLSYAYDPPLGQAKFKSCNSDFIVRETLSFEPEGEGTHAYLYIAKSNTNTEWLARQLARFVGVEAREIGYAGLKDRNALTEQWFSINLEICNEPDWEQFQVDGVKILKRTLHRRKLKRGVIKYNSFEIILRDIKGSSKEELLDKVNTIKQSGVPNYFAQQRFGHDYNNLSRAARWFSGAVKIKKRAEKSMTLSAARSMVFNQMLSQRIQQSGWDTLLDGDVMMLDGTHSLFSTTEVDNELKQRFQQRDIHPTAALWGRGELSSSHNLLKLEQATASSLGQWCASLEKQGLKQDRRGARVFPENLTIDFADGSLLADGTLEKVTLSFSLPSGAYATAVLREIIQF